MPQTNSPLSTRIPQRKRVTRASWDALDELPPRLRRLIWEAPTAIDPKTISGLAQTYGETQAFRDMLASINNELRIFAEEYQEKHRRPLPSWAADVTRQGY